MSTEGDLLMVVQACFPY